METFRRPLALTKELANNDWDWFPCGVQCSAGELVSMDSDLTGGTWTVTDTNLAKSGCGGPGLIRSGSQYVLADMMGRVRLATDGTGSTVATAVFDAFGVQRYGTGALAAGVIRNTYGNGNEDGMMAMLQARQAGQAEQQLDCDKKLELCTKLVDSARDNCRNKCTGAIGGSCAVLCGAVCVISIGFGCGFCLGACAATLMACYDRCERKYKNDLSYCYNTYKKCRAQKGKPVLGSTMRFG